MSPGTESPPHRFTTELMKFVEPAHKDIQTGIRRVNIASHGVENPRPLPPGQVPLWTEVLEAGLSHQWAQDV